MEEMNMSSGRIPPRSIRMLEEFEEGTSTAKDPSLSFGPEDRCDPQLTRWNATIIDLSGNIMTFLIICGPKYPLEKPEIEVVDGVKSKFIRVVDGRKLLDKKYFPKLTTWNPETKLSALLTHIRS